MKQKENDQLAMIFLSNFWFDRPKEDMRKAVSLLEHPPIVIANIGIHFAPDIIEGRGDKFVNALRFTLEALMDVLPIGTEVIMLDEVWRSLSNAYHERWKN